MEPKETQLDETPGNTYWDTGNEAWVINFNRRVKDWNWRRTFPAAFRTMYKRERAAAKAQRAERA